MDELAHSPFRYEVRPAPQGSLSGVWDNLQDEWAGRPCLGKQAAKTACRKLNEGRVSVATQANGRAGNKPAGRGRSTPHKPETATRGTGREMIVSRSDKAGDCAPSTVAEAEPASDDSGAEIVEGAPLRPVKAAEAWPAGADARLQGAIFRAMIEDFEQGGRLAIRKVRKERPLDYLKLVAALSRGKPSGPRERPKITRLRHCFVDP